MTALMNFIGFDGSAFGNHEFDNGQAGLPKVMASSNFPYLCANVHAAPEMGINPLPYKIYDVGGLQQKLPYMITVCFIIMRNNYLIALHRSFPSFLNNRHFETMLLCVFFRRTSSFAVNGEIIAHFS